MLEGSARAAPCQAREHGFSQIDLPGELSPARPGLGKSCGQREGQPELGSTSKASKGAVVASSSHLLGHQRWIGRPGGAQMALGPLFC